MKQKQKSLPLEIGFSAKPGEHKALMKYPGNASPEKSLEEQITQLRAKTHKNGCFLMIKGIGLGGYQEKEAVLTYHIITQKEGRQIIKEKSSQAYMLF